MQKTLYTCNDTGNIFEQSYRDPAAFCVVREYSIFEIRRKTANKPAKSAEE